MTFEMVAKQAQKALPLKLRATMVQLRATIMVVYAAQGARLAAKLAAAIYLRSQLEEDFRQESSAKAAGIMAMAMLPWSLKPLYGLVTDTVPLFGYFRRSYLMASGLLGTCSWLLLAYSPDASWIGLGRPTLTLILLWLTNLATAFSDVVVDAMIARASKTESGAPDLVAGAQLQTLARFSRAGGGLLSSLAGGFLLESFSPQWIFGLTSLPSLAIALLASGLNESRAAPVSAHSIPGELKMQAKRLSAHLATGGLGWPLLWFFCARALPPSYHALLVYYQMDVLALSTSFLGIQSALGWMAMGVGTLVYNSCLKRLQLRRILVYSTFMGILAHSSTLILLGGYHRQFEIPDGVFALSSEIVTDVIHQMRILPFLVFAGSFCPENLEGTLFAFFMSVFNFGGSVASYNESILANLLSIERPRYDNLWILVVIRMLVQLLLLLPLPWIFRDYARNKSSSSLLGKS